MAHGAKTQNTQQTQTPQKANANAAPRNELTTSAIRSYSTYSRQAKLFGLSRQRPYTATNEKGKAHANDEEVCP